MEAAKDQNWAVEPKGGKILIDEGKFYTKIIMWFYALSA
jgi:hypothetical protein